MVSDGAKALIKLALEGLGCTSVPDLFHALRDLGQPLGSAIGRQYSQLKKQQHKPHEQLTKTISETKLTELEEKREQLTVQRQALESTQITDHQTLLAITQAIHPFNLTTGGWQLGQELSSCLSSSLSQRRSQAIRYGTNKAQTAIDTFERHIPSFAEGIHAWWRWGKPCAPGKN